MNLDGTFRQVQLLGDQAVGQTSHHQVQHLRLTLGQTDLLRAHATTGSWRWRRQFIQTRHFRQTGAVDIAFQHMPHGMQQFAAVQGFGNEAGSAQVNGPGYRRRVIEG